MLFRCRPSQVAQWPAWEVDLLEHYLAKRPAGEDRIEIAIATLWARWVSSQSKNGGAIDPSKYLPFCNPWPEDVEPDVGSGRYSPLDLEIMGRIK